MLPQKVEVAGLEPAGLRVKGLPVHLDYSRFLPAPCSAHRKRTLHGVYVFRSEWEVELPRITAAAPVDMDWDGRVAPNPVTRYGVRRPSPKNDGLAADAAGMCAIHIRSNATPSLTSQALLICFRCLQASQSGCHSFLSGGWYEEIRPPLRLILVRGVFVG